MSTYRNLTSLCAAVVLAFGLAACGGGGSAPTVDPGPDPTMPPEPPAPTAEALKADAADAITAAANALMAGEQAEKDALKYAGMLTAESVKGDSAMAVANAEKILAAEMAANQAVMDADDALNDAMDAKTAAEALPEDDAERASAIAAAERAIEEATADKKAAQAILDKNPLQADGTTPTTEVDSLRDAVAAVKGSNRLAEGYPMMPAAIGKRIAGEVMTAIGTATPGTNGTIADATSMDGIMNDAADIGAMTWAMIVGEDNIMMERIGGTNANLPVASIAGMAASAVDKTDTAVLVSTGTFVDGTAYGTATVTGTAGTEYKGIPGAVWCLGGTDGCSVGADGTLSSGWYFTPADADELYVANPDMAGMYMVATMYATYGYWLTYDDTTDAATGIALYSNNTGASTTLDLGQAGTGDDATDVTATYSGSAVGISKRGDNSGQFTADVNLTATFAVAPMLRGRISNFQGGAVGNWTVLLNETALNATAGFDAVGTTAGGGAAGEWTAQGYGPAPIDHDGDTTTPLQNQRPTGFHGRFDANFGDGAAAGAFATRADE